MDRSKFGRRGCELGEVWHWIEKKAYNETGSRNGLPNKTNKQSWILIYIKRPRKV